MEAYETITILGEGTYGVVIKARHKATGQIVAIKKFKQTEDDEHVRKTSLREVRVLKQLRHLNVVGLLDVFRREGKLYLVFEYIDHTVLQLLEKTNRGLSPNDVRKYMYQLLRGIDYCHAHNIIHRDVKPENILISQDGILKLCDFGFARVLSSKAKYTDYVATRWYRAPELLVGDTAYGKPVDIWAVGCLLAELTDSQPLFPGESDLDQLSLIISYRGAIPQRMVDLFARNPYYRKVTFPKPSKHRSLRQRYARQTPEWQEFLYACLNTEPGDRLTCSELMGLPYFTKDNFRSEYEAELRRCSAASLIPPLVPDSGEGGSSPSETPTEAASMVIPPLQTAGNGLKNAPTASPSAEDEAAASAASGAPSTAAAPGQSSLTAPAAAHLLPPPTTAAAAVAATFPAPKALTTFAMKSPGEGHEGGGEKGDEESEAGGGRGGAASSMPVPAASSKEATSTSTALQLPNISLTPGGQLPQSKAMIGGGADEPSRISPPEPPPPVPCTSVSTPFSPFTHRTTPPPESGGVGGSSMTVPPSTLTFAAADTTASHPAPLSPISRPSPPPPPPPAPQSSSSPLPSVSLQPLPQQQQEVAQRSSGNATTFPELGVLWSQYLGNHPTLSYAVSQSSRDGALPPPAPPSMSTVTAKPHPTLGASTRQSSTPPLPSIDMTGSGRAITGTGLALSTSPATGVAPTSSSKLAPNALALLSSRSHRGTEDATSNGEDGESHLVHTPHYPTTHRQSHTLSNADATGGRKPTSKDFGDGTVKTPMPNLLAALPPPTSLMTALPKSKKVVTKPSVVRSRGLGESPAMADARSGGDLHLASDSVSRTRPPQQSLLSADVVPLQRVAKEGARNKYTILKHRSPEQKKATVEQPQSTRRAEAALHALYALRDQSGPPPLPPPGSMQPLSTGAAPTSPPPTQRRTSQQTRRSDGTLDHSRSPSSVGTAGADTCSTAADGDAAGVRRAAGVNRITATRKRSDGSNRPAKRKLAGPSDSLKKSSRTVLSTLPTNHEPTANEAGAGRVVPSPPLW